MAQGTKKIFDFHQNIPKDVMIEYKSSVPKVIGQLPQDVCII